MPDGVTGLVQSAVVPGNAEASAKPIEILQLGLNWFAAGSGGLDRVFADFARSLPAENIRVSGLVVQPSNVSELTSGQFRTFSHEHAGLLQRLAGARRQIRLAALKAQVVVPHFAMHMAAALPCRERPIVAHFHGPWAQEASAEGSSRPSVAARHLIERSVYKRADRIVVLSEAFARIIVEHYGVQADRVRIVRGAVDTKRFDHGMSRSMCREILGWPKDQPIILAVRRLCARMGLETLIEAFSMMSKRQPDALLVIGGKGPLENTLKARAAELGIQDKVRFLGFVPDDVLPLVYSAADLHVMPSFVLEGFGLSAAESLAAGTPSIVTPVGGLPEVVNALSPQLVLPGTTASVLAAALQDVFHGTTHLPSAAECRAYAQRSFSLARAAREAAAIYREVA